VQNKAIAVRKGDGPRSPALHIPPTQGPSRPATDRLEPPSHTSRSSGMAAKQESLATPPKKTTRPTKEEEPEHQEYIRTPSRIPLDFFFAPSMIPSVIRFVCHLFTQSCRGPRLCRPATPRRHGLQIAGGAVGRQGNHQVARSTQPGANRLLKVALVSGRSGSGPDRNGENPERFKSPDTSVTLVTAERPPCVGSFCTPFPCHLVAW